jgi:hypothetical protein
MLLNRQEEGQSLDRDCTAGKVVKNTVLKTTVREDSPCGPVDTAKNTAKNALEIDDQKHKKKDKKKRKASVINN